MVRFDEGKEKKRREERNQIDLEIHSNDFSFFSKKRSRAKWYNMHTSLLTDKHSWLFRSSRLLISNYKRPVNFTESSYRFVRSTITFYSSNSVSDFTW